MRLPGTLRKTTYTGPLVSYAVDCGGATLTVDRHRPGPEDLLEPGSRVEVIVPPDSVLAFDPESGERL